VVAGVGAVLVGSTLGEASTIERECGTSCPPSRWEKYRTLQTTGDVLVVVGAAAVAAGVVWWVMTPSATSQRRAGISPTPFGLLFQGSL
jgi:hypothetical protein